MDLILNEKYVYRKTAAIQVGEEEKGRDPNFLKVLTDISNSNKTDPTLKKKAVETLKALEE